MSKLSKSILDTIHKKKITPQSRWYFIAIHSLLWICFGVTLIVGIIAVSLIFMEMSMPERPYMQWMPLPWPMKMLRYLPFLWGIGAIICVTIAYFVFYKTDRGYRIPTLWIVWILILGSFTGWYALHQTKINAVWEKQMQRLVPPYGRMREEMKKWMPRLLESGLLPWKIETINDDEYTIKTPDKKIWKVSLDCKDEDCREAQKNLKKGKPMLFRGEIKENEKEDEDDEIFEATDIEPLPKQGCRKNKKDASCWSALMPLPPKENFNKKY